MEGGIVQTHDDGMKHVIVHEYEGTTNNIKKWLAEHNKERLHEGSMLEHEDEFSFEEIDLSIYKESENEC